MRFENIRVMNFENALRGMRNPKESYHLIDSAFGLGNFEDCETDFDVVESWIDHLEIDRLNEDERDFAFAKLDNWLIKNGVLYKCGDFFEYAFIGPQDMRLAQKLIRGGSEHRKFMRQIFISVDITAPLYWWKEFDTYKVGTTANSTSTMHTICNKPITLDCFEIDDFENIEYPPECQRPEIQSTCDKDFVQMVLIPYLEYLRQKYVETKDNKYWKELIRWLPESWQQTRTVTMTYENALAIGKQRRHHKLNEWTGDKVEVDESFMQFLRDLPYAQDFIFIDEFSEGTKFPAIDF